MLTLQETIRAAGKEYYEHYMDGGNGDPVPTRWISEIYKVSEDYLVQEIEKEFKKLLTKV